MRLTLAILLASASLLMGQAFTLNDPAFLGQSAPSSGGGSSPSSLPAEWYTNLVMRTADPQWVYSVGPTGFRSSEAFLFQNLHIETNSGPGWTPGVYAPGLGGLFQSLSTQDGSQDCYYLNSSPAAAETRNGVGWFAHFWGTLKALFYGNSLTAGEGATGAQHYYPWRVGQRSSNDWFWPINLGHAAWTTAMLITNYPVEVAPLYDAAKNSTIYIWEWTNDRFLGADAATCQSNIVHLCSLAKATGFRVVVMSALPRSEPGTPASFETDRGAFNGFLREAFATSTSYAYAFLPSGTNAWADLFLDVAADTRIGDAGDETDTTYYSGDETHMNNTGYDVIAVHAWEAWKVLP